MSGRPFARGGARGGHPDRGSTNLPHHGRGRGRGGPMATEIYSPGTASRPQPDPRVQKLENETETACQKIIPSASTNPGVDNQLPLRAGYGTQGRPVLLLANYFELVTSPDLLLFRYSIDVLPDETGKKPTGRNLKRIIELLLEEHVSPRRSDIATDYKSFLLCRSAFLVENAAYHVRYRSEGEDEPSSNARSYRVRLRDAGTLQMSQLIDYMTSSNASALFDSKEEFVQALNIVLGHYPKTVSSIVSVGANKHFDSSPAGADLRNLGAGFAAIRGLFISVRAATSRLLVNVQVKHAAFYREGPLDTLMLEYKNDNGPNMVKLKNFLTRLRVRVTHIVKTNQKGRPIPRIKTITNLASPQDGRGLEHPPIVHRFGAGAKEVLFYLGSPTAPGDSQGPAKTEKKSRKTPWKGGSAAPKDGYISVYEFFRRNYNVTIKDPNMPVVNVGSPDTPSYLPADVCIVVSGQASSAKLSAFQTTKMIDFAVRKPAQNAQSVVTSGVRMLGINSSTNTALNSFDIKVKPELITVPGRVLTGPAVKYKGNKAANPALGSWNMVSIQFATSARLPSWTYLLLSMEDKPNSWSSEQDLDATIRTFQAKLKEVGIDVAAFTPGLKITLKGENFDAQIDATLKRFVSNAARKPPELLLVILPKEDTSMYNAIKRGCDIKYGLRNVCVIASKFAKPNNHQYFANVALKFNLKLGGQNQTLDNSKLGIIAEGKTMVVGIDVTHPSPGSASNTPSVAGVVASVDPYLGQWPADLQVQTARQEMVEGLDGMLKSRLTLWAKKNRGSYPENILIYRDGVSEGQYNIVLDQELPLLRKACRETYPANNAKKGLPRMSIVVVGKRHNTRFYPTREADADKFSNPQNGTVVDRGVTEARNWDFYLQAHSALKGTARPAHYYVILDEIFRYAKPRPPFKNSADMLEDLTHNMCYLFGRATKAVSICPPAYYADLVCERARRYMSRLFDATPDASTAGSMVKGAEPEMGPDSGAVRVHEKVRDTMFYI